MGATASATLRSATWQLQSTPSGIGGCQNLDRTSVFHSTVAGLPVHARSDEWLRHLGTDQAVASRVGSRAWQGSRPGIPFNFVDSRVTPQAPINYPPEYPAGTWVATVPMPADPLVEGDPTPAWDRHVVVVDSATCDMFELVAYNKALYQMAGIHWAVRGVIWQLGAGSGLVPQAGTTVSAAPESATLPRVDEVRAGRIDHVIGACSAFTSATAVWPARGADGTDPSPSAIPIGSRLRLRSTVDVARYTGQSRVIAQALRDHGLLVSDTCDTALAFHGENAATGWDDANLGQLDNLRIGDFEVVDAAPMMISADSWQVR